MLYRCDLRDARRSVTPKQNREIEDIRDGDELVHIGRSMARDARIKTEGLTLRVYELNRGSQGARVAEVSL